MLIGTFKTKSPSSPARRLAPALSRILSTARRSQEAEEPLHLTTAQNSPPELCPSAWNSLGRSGAPEPGPGGSPAHGSCHPPSRSPLGFHLLGGGDAEKGRPEVTAAAGRNDMSCRTGGWPQRKHCALKAATRKGFQCFHHQETTNVRGDRHALHDLNVTVSTCTKQHAVCTVFIGRS